METIKSTDINVNNIIVATYNADPFEIESDIIRDNIKDTLAAAGYVDVYTAEDEDFADLAAKLGYESEMPSKIYVVNGNELTFALY